MKKPKAGEVMAITSNKKKSRASTLKKVSTKKAAPGKTKTKGRPKVKGPHKLKPTDVLGKSIVVTSSDTLGRKIKIIENISSRRKEKKSTYTPVGTPSLAEFKTKVHLALATPFKFNMDHGQLASHVARSAGTAFALVGAILTLYNMNAIASFMDIPSHSLPAQTTTCLAGTSCTTDTNTTNNTTTLTNTINENPTVDISLESSSATIAGTVPVNVTVTHASRVDLIAKNKVTNQSITVGTLSKISDLVWRTYWQTSILDDGVYRLKAVVTNQFGTYTHEDLTEYTVLNHQTNEEQTASDGSLHSIDPTSGTASDVSTAFGTTTDAQKIPETTQTTPLPQLRVEIQQTEPLRNTADVRTFVSGALKVQHFIRLRGTTNYTALGYATLYSGVGGEWRFALNTLSLKDGEYDLLTKAYFQNNTTNTHVVQSIAIKNLVDNVAPKETIDSVETVDEKKLDGDVHSKINFEFTKQNPLEGIVDVYMQIVGVQFVELYVRPEGSLTQRYLGLASKQYEGAWKFRFDTTLIPNGNYSFFAKVRSQYGDTTSDIVPIVIKNAATLPIKEETQAYIESLKLVGEETKGILGTDPTGSMGLPPTTEEDGESVTPQPSRYDALRKDIGEEYTEEISETLDQFNEELIRIMHDFGRALREGNEDRARILLGELEIIRDEIMMSLPYSDDQSEILGKIRNYMETIIKEFRERTEESEMLIKNRVGDAVLKDSDSDGVSDYDEVNLYDTDPMRADTDMDGYIDGIEILNGYDPKNSTREANIVYESPREHGVVREDILEITYITTLVNEIDDNKEIKAQIGGRALPHSFVTIYIFSTPIILTIKTDDGGNWSYTFDKELENGEHEIYVGMTDNAGKIVAKSNPLPFIKTAEAFTPIDQTNTVMVTPVEPALISENALLVIGSISVVALGLILILLGLHVRPREKVEEFVQPA